MVFKGALHQARAGAVIAILVLTAFFSATTAWAQAQPPLTDEEQADLNIWRLTLADPANGSVTRRRAVTHLLNRDWVEAHEVLGQALQTFDDAELVRIVASEIRLMTAPPEALMGPLLDAFLDAPVELLPTLEQAVTSYPPTIIPDVAALCSSETIDVDARCRLIEILSRFAYWEAVDGLLPLLDEAQPHEIRSAADHALTAITGQSPGASRARWQSWIRQNRQEGREGLLARKLDRLEVDLESIRQNFMTSQRQRNALLSELVAAYEQWYASLNDPAARDALILDLMKKDRPEINQLALSLIEQRKANAEPVSPELVQVVYPAMDHADAPVRQAATRVLGLLDAEEAARAAAQRFPTEANEAVVREMLALLAVHPVPESVDDLLVRLETESTGRSALAPLLAASRAGLCDDQALQQIAYTVLASDSLNLLPEAINLLAWTRDNTALNYVVTILRDAEEDVTRRTAAARGLGASGRRDGDLIDLLADPVVFDAAVRALVRQGDTAAVNQLLTAPVPQEDLRIAGIARVLAVLDPETWIEVDDALAASGIMPVENRVVWLSDIFNRPNGDQAEVDGLVRRAICLRLARLHLGQNDPGAAMAALQSAPAHETAASEFAILLAMTQIALGRLGDVAPDTSLDTWLSGLNLLLDIEDQTPEQVSATIAAIQERFSEVLTEEQSSRLAAIDAESGTEREPETEQPTEGGGG